MRTSSLSSIPLSWARSPLASLLTLAWPLIVSMLSLSAMTLVDTLFVSRLGAASLAGVGLAGILVFNLWCFPLGLVNATKILTSQAVGAGHPEHHRQHLAAALGVGVALGALSAAAGLLVALALPHLTATEASGHEASAYLSTRILASVPIMALTAIEQTRQGLGDTRAPMMAGVAANLLNVPLTYAGIFVLGWGVEGAAWGSNVATTAQLAMMIRFQAKRDGFQLVGTGLGHVKALLRLGVPNGLQLAMEVGAFGLMVLMLSALSETHTAANQIAIQVLHFAFLPVHALSEAGSVLVGQAVGAKRGDLVGRVAAHTLGAAMAHATLCAVVLLFGARLIVAGFTSDPALAELALRLFTIVAFFQIGDAASMVARGILRGTGDVRFVASVCIPIAWVCTPPMTYLLGYTAGLGAVGAWVGLSMEVTVSALILWRRITRGGWQHAAATVLV